jgi:hypothetical protein
LSQNNPVTDFFSQKSHFLGFSTETVFDDVVAHVLKVIQSDAVNKYKVLFCFFFDDIVFFTFTMTIQKNVLTKFSVS